MITTAIIIYSSQPLTGEEGADHEGESTTASWKVFSINLHYVMV